MRIENVLSMNALDASTTQTSSAMEASSMFCASAQAVVTGDTVGTLKFQASNDNSSPLAGSQVSHWSDITQSVAVSGAAVYMIPKFDCCYQYLRLVYTRASGTGTITVNARLNGF